MRPLSISIFMAMTFFCGTSGVNTVGFDELVPEVLITRLGKDVEPSPYSKVT